MSRITKAIIESAFLDKKVKKCIIFSHPQELDGDTLNTPIDFFSFQEHPANLNKKITVVSPQNVNDNLSFLPDINICTWLGVYPDSKNLSATLKIPQVNILKSNSLIIKKEPLFEFASGPLLEDINLVESAELAQQLYISNYSIITNNLLNQILTLIDKIWKPI